MLHTQLQGIDFRTQATSLGVPVDLAQGAHEAPGRAGPAQHRYDLLQAPSKRLVVLNRSGHRSLWEQPARFHDLMVTVLAGTAQSN